MILNFLKRDSRESKHNRHNKFSYPAGLVRKTRKTTGDYQGQRFGLVSSEDAKIQQSAMFPDQIENILLYSDYFHEAARIIRLQVMEDPAFANEIRWQPAYKQFIYRDGDGRLIVTISQNSVGNAIHYRIVGHCSEENRR